MSSKSTFLAFLLVTAVRTQSSKKGVCVPPGTNFHCGDLAPFTNVRYIVITGDGVNEMSLNCYTI